MLVNAPPSILLKSTIVPCVCSALGAASVWQAGGYGLRDVEDLGQSTHMLATSKPGSMHLMARHSWSSVLPLQSSTSNFVSLTPLFSLVTFAAVVVLVYASRQHRQLTFFCARLSTSFSAPHLSQYTHSFLQAHSHFKNRHSRHQGHP